MNTALPPARSSQTTTFAKRAFERHRWRVRSRPPDRKQEVMDSNIDQAKGRIKQAAADLTDDEELRREGKNDEAAGKAKGVVDDMKRKADDLIDRAKDTSNKY